MINNTLEARIARLEKLVKNESRFNYDWYEDCYSRRRNIASRKINESMQDFNSCKDAVEAWFWKMNDKNKGDDRWIEELGYAKARNSVNGFLLGDCIAEVGDRNPACYSCKTQIKNLLAKLANQALREMGIRLNSDDYKTTHGMTYSH